MNKNPTTAIMPPRATIRDVARQAGVSIGSVSRVLNRAGNVDPALEARIFEAIRVLNYRPARRAGGSQREGVPPRHGVVGLLLVGFTENWRHAPPMTGYIRGIEQTCRERGYDVMLHLCSPEELPGGTRKLASRCDGFLVNVNASCSAAALSVMTELSRRTPTVGFGMLLPGYHFPQFTFDNFATGSLLAEELLRRGHRRIAFVNPVPTHVMFIARSLGFTAALKAAGVWDPALLIEDRVSDTREPEKLLPDLTAVLARLRALTPPVTAVITANDWAAAGLYRACTAAGLRIPDDFSVAGFDNDPLGQVLNPPLASIDNPFDRLGAMAANWLVGIIEKRTAYCQEMATIQYLSGRLILRESVANLPNKEK